MNWWRRRRIGICLFFVVFVKKTHECLQQIALREPAILFFCLQNIKELHSPLPFTITVAPAYVLFVLHVVYTWINFNSDFCDVKIYAHWWFLWRHNLRALFVDRWLYTISQLFLQYFLLFIVRSLVLRYTTESFDTSVSRFNNKSLFIRVGPS